MLNSSDLEFAATVDNFHFSVPFSEVFLSGSVCVQVSTFPSFAIWPSFDKFMAWKRSAHKRIRGHKFHSILEQFTDDTLNLSQDQKEKVVYSRVGSTVKKKKQMLQIQQNTNAKGTKSRSKTYKPYRCFLVDKKRHNLNMDAN